MQQLVFLINTTHMLVIMNDVCMRTRTHALLQLYCKVRYHHLLFVMPPLDANRSSMLCCCLLYSLKLSRLALGSVQALMATLVFSPRVKWLGCEGDHISISCCSYMCVSTATPSHSQYAFLTWRGATWCVLCKAGNFKIEVHQIWAVWLFMRVGRGWNLGQSFFEWLRSCRSRQLPFLEVFKTLMSHLNGAVKHGWLA